MGRASDLKVNRGQTSKPRTLRLKDERSEFDTAILLTQPVWDVVEFVVQEGGALRFGLTMDKGALAVGIYGLGDPQTKYCRTDAEVAQLMDAIYHSFKGDVE